MMSTGKIALGLIAAVLLASFAQLYGQPQVAAFAERLTEVAQRLQELAHCRNQVLQGVVQNGSALAEVLSLTSTGDNFLTRYSIFFTAILCSWYGVTLCL